MKKMIATEGMKKAPLMSIIDQENHIKNAPQETIDLLYKHYDKFRKSSEALKKEINDIIKRLPRDDAIRLFGEDAVNGIVGFSLFMGMAAERALGISK